MNTDQTVNAWYFSWPDHRIEYRSRRKAALGVTHHYRGVPRVGCSGLHAGTTLRAALDDTRQPILWRVELSGRIDTSGEFLAAQRRRYIGGGVDISAALCVWARQCVQGLIKRGPPDAAARPIMKWLKGNGSEAHRAAVLEYLSARKRQKIPGLLGDLENLAYQTAIARDMRGMELVSRNCFVAEQCIRMGGLSRAETNALLDRVVMEIMEGMS